MAAERVGFAVLNRQREVRIALPGLRKFLGRVREELGLAETEAVIADLTPHLGPVAFPRTAAAAPGATLDAPEIGRLLADARTIGEHVPVRLVRRDRFGGLEAVDSRGVILRFGADADLPAKLALVEPIRNSAAHGRPLRAIDLRAPATPVVEFP